MIGILLRYCVSVFSKEYKKYGYLKVCLVLNNQKTGTPYVIISVELEQFLHSYKVKI